MERDSFSSGLGSEQRNEDNLSNDWNILKDAKEGGDESNDEKRDNDEYLHDDGESLVDFIRDSKNSGCYYRYGENSYDRNVDPESGIEYYMTYKGAFYVPNGYAISIDKTEDFLELPEYYIFCSTEDPYDARDISIDFEKRRMRVVDLCDSENHRIEKGQLVRDGEGDEFKYYLNGNSSLEEFEERYPNPSVRATKKVETMIFGPWIEGEMRNDKPKRLREVAVGPKTGNIYYVDTYDYKGKLATRDQYSEDEHRDIVESDWGDRKRHYDDIDDRWLSGHNEITFNASYMLDSEEYIRTGSELISASRRNKILEGIVRDLLTEEEQKAVYGEGEE